MLWLMKIGWWLAGVFKVTPKKKETSTKSKVMNVSTCHHDVLQSTHVVELERLHVRQWDFETSVPSPSLQAATPLPVSHHKSVTGSHHLLQ